MDFGGECMVVSFSKEEQKYIIVEKGRWKVADNCPDNIKVRLRKKIAFLLSEGGKQDG